MFFSLTWALGEAVCFVVGGFFCVGVCFLFFFLLSLEGMQGLPFHATQ